VVPARSFRRDGGGRPVSRRPLLSSPLRAQHGCFAPPLCPFSTSYTRPFAFAFMSWLELKGRGELVVEMAGG
jgi:hypothetical protein